MIGQDIWSVSELTSHIKATIEPHFGDLRVEGEISNLRSAASGHLYFTLKDRDAVIAAALFRGQRRSLNFQPVDGMKVIASGSISIYAKRGNYQIICTALRSSGMGAILLELEERKRRLAEEGLFDTERKRGRPSYPRRVAVVTSPDGAAIRDILQVMGRRNAGIDLVILPTTVQGDEAAASIAAQIRCADMLKLGEIIIVARGGGSLEDLLPFSEEVVVRAVAEATTPIISAVGHEIDVSLCDLAADLQVPTPSAAAELVAEDSGQLQRHILMQGRNIVHSFLGRLHNARLTIDRVHPEKIAQSLRLVIQPLYQRLDDARTQMAHHFDQRSIRLRHRLMMAAQALATLSPQSILGRGFALVRRARDNQPISDASHVEPGEPIDIQFAASLLRAAVLQEDSNEEL